MRSRLPTLMLLAGVASAGACALLDAAFPAVFTDTGSVCGQFAKLAELCGRPYDVGSCESEIQCLRADLVDCGEAWDGLLSCLNDEDWGDCDSTCDDEYTALLACSGGDDPAVGERQLFECRGEGGELLTLAPICGNGRCQTVLGETPDNCSGDCPGCPDPEPMYCSAALPGCGICQCDVNESACDPTRGNAYTCNACTCNENGECEPGESVYACPHDCACDFDGVCEIASGSIPAENYFGCPADCAQDCGSGCKPFGQSCNNDEECELPLRCYEGTSGGKRCGYPCSDGTACPTGAVCNGGYCFPI